MHFDEIIMRRVLALARKGSGKVSPNPMVGAIILKRGLVVGRGYHRVFGGSHAEIEALEKINFEAEGCKLYTNLEPCAHFGKTPPCVHSIIKSGIKEVVVGMVDPNPLVAGKGIETLKEAGINVEVGVLENECRILNEAYVKFIRTNYPFVIMKVASTLDGKIALASGKSKWITSPESRTFVHDLRNDVDAVLVGANTVRIDNPGLGVRLSRRFVKHPLRIVLDTNLSTSLRAKVYNRKLGGKTIVFTSGKASPLKVKIFRKSGIDVIIKKNSGKYLDVKSILAELHKKNVSSVLVEGGKEVFTTFFKSGLVDKLVLMYGNKIVGGEQSVSSFGGIGVSKLNQAFTLENLSVIKLAQDLIVTGYLN